MTRAQFEDLRRRIDREAPTRARGVLTLLASVDIPEAKNHRARRTEKRRKHHRHPARRTAQERRRAWHDPSPAEQAIREINRLVRKHQRSAPDEDGKLAGLLQTAAAFAVVTLLKDFGLDETHAAPFEHWLTWKLGQTLRDPDVQGYLAWRESCRTEVA